MNQTSWLPNLITEDKDEDLVQLVLSSLNHDKEMIRAFAVALLEKNTDEVAREINDILVVDIRTWDADLRHKKDIPAHLRPGPDEDETLDPRGL